MELFGMDSLWVETDKAPGEVSLIEALNKEVHKDDGISGIIIVNINAVPIIGLAPR